MPSREPSEKIFLGVVPCGRRALQHVRGGFVPFPRADDAKRVRLHFISLLPGQGDGVLLNDGLLFEGGELFLRELPFLGIDVVQLGQILEDGDVRDSFGFLEIQGGEGRKSRDGLRIPDSGAYPIVRLRCALAGTPFPRATRIRYIASCWRRQRGRVEWVARRNRTGAVFKV